MSENHGVVYMGPGKVEVRNIAFPKLSDLMGVRLTMKIVATNICGFDQHMVRVPVRSPLPIGIVFVGRCDEFADTRSCASVNGT